MRRICTTLLLGAALGGAPLLAQDSASPTEKSALRVLVVSHDPEAPQTGFADPNEPRTLELFEERSESWKTFLEGHFEHVALVHGESYEVTMSNAVDVTLFDALPPARNESGWQEDEVTGERTYVPPSYLPDDFSRPALMIGPNTPRIGEPLGLKLDWL